MSYSNTVAHQLPPSANGHHRSVQKTNELNEEEMEKYLSLSVPVLPAPSAAVASSTSAMRTIPTKAVNKNNEYNTINDYNEEELHSATTPSPVPHIAAAEWRHHSHNSTHHSQSHSLERERNSLHKNHNKMRSQSKTKTSHDDKISNEHYNDYDREEQRYTDNDKRRNNMKKKQNVHYLSQPTHLTNRRYTSEKQENLLNKYNKISNEKKEQLSSKQLSNRENYTSHHHQHHHSLHEQKLEEEQEVKQHSKTAHSLPLRERNNKYNMNETMWNLRRLEAILQPTYNSTFRATSSFPFTSSSPPYASTRVERSKQQQQQHEEQYNNNKELQAQTSRIDFSKRTESFLNGNNNSNSNTRASVESTSLHPIRITPPLPSKTIITPPTTNNNTINNNSKNNMLVVAANAEEHAYLLSEYVNKLEKEVNAISLEHAESCKLLICFAEEREQFGVITNEQEKRSSIVEDESRALFDMYVLFTTVTLHRTETRWMQEMSGMHVEVQALREANTKLENNKVNNIQEHNKREEYDEVAPKQQISANNELKEQQDMSKEQIDTDSRYTLAEALAAAAVITIEPIKSSASDKTENETILQTVHEYENITNNETTNVELRFTTFVKDLCKELHISCSDSTSHYVLAPSEELLESVVLKLKELRKQESEPNADKQKKMLELYESQETSKMMTEYFASFMTHFSIVNELYNEYCESKCEFANDSAELLLCVERIKLQHWHSDTEQFNEEKHIALLETLKSLRLQVEQYKGVLESMEKEQQLTQQQQHEMEINENAKSSISNSNSISLSAYSAQCVSELPYIPSRMKLHVQPANRSFHATEMDQIRKEAIRLGARESTNVVTNTINMPQISKNDAYDCKSDNQATTLAVCQKEANDTTMKDKQEKQFKDIVSNRSKEETQNNKIIEREERIDNNKINNNNNTTSTKDNTYSISDVNNQSASVHIEENCNLQETKKNSGSTDNKVNTNNTTTTIVTPALTVPVIKRFVVKTTHSTSSYSSYSTYSRSSSSVASDANSHTSTVQSSEKESKHTEINKVNTSKRQESENATAVTKVNIAVYKTQDVENKKENKSKEVVLDEKLKGQDVRPQESHLENNTKVLVEVPLEKKNNDKKQIKASEEHYKEEKKGNADASSYYSSSSSSSSYSRRISVTSSSSSSSRASNTNKNDKKNIQGSVNHKTSRKALTDRANESTHSKVNKVNKSSDECNSTNVQKCITNSEAEKMSKEADKKSSDTKQVKKENVDNLEECKDNKVIEKKGKSHIEYDDSLTLDVSLTMDDSESDADTNGNSSGSINEKQLKTLEIVINKTNAPSIRSNGTQGENSSKITTQNVKVNSEIVADSVEKNKLKRRSSFDDDMDEQDVIDKASANSNVSKIVANIARQNQFTNMYANSKSSKFK